MELTQIMKTIAYIFLVFVFSGIFHELGHCIMCLILHCKILELKIWFVLIKFDEGKIKAEIHTKGKEHCSFRTNSKIKMMKIMLSGPAINGIIAVLFVLYTILNGVNCVGVFGIGYNLLLMIYELYPGSHGDGYMIKKTIEEIRKES